MKRHDFAYDSEAAIELGDLLAQVDEAPCQRGGIVNFFGLKKAVERGFDKRGFCGPATLGRGSQFRGCAFGEIDANSGFHYRDSPKSMNEHRSAYCMVEDLALHHRPR